MKYLIGFILLTIVGCQDLNSNSGDEAKYGALNLTGTAEFNTAFRILRARCMTCHQHQNWGNYTNEQQWEDNGLVVQGDPDNSSVINRIKNYNGGNSDMPTDDGPLPDDEYQSLVDWVTNFP